MYLYIWMYGRMELWVFGCIEIHGCMDVRMYGFMLVFLTAFSLASFVNSVHPIKSQKLTITSHEIHFILTTFHPIPIATAVQLEEDGIFDWGKFEID